MPDSLTSLRYRRLWLATGWLMVLIVLILSLMPRPPQPLNFGGADKVEHVLAYFILMGWFAQIYHEARTRLWIAIGLIAMGIAIEILQPILAPRFFEWWDMLADTIGVLLAWALAGPRLSMLLTDFERRFLVR
ncbi:MAG TPA: VanZ family protein [Gammaproteobacteria bacterium]|nr:VanZ family protein [Gammaproteobacteria bacterium]